MCLFVKVDDPTHVGGQMNAVGFELRQGEDYRWTPSSPPCCVAGYTCGGVVYGR